MVKKRLLRDLRQSAKELLLELRQGKRLFSEQTEDKRRHPPRRRRLSGRLGDERFGQGGGLLCQ